MDRIARGSCPLAVFRLAASWLIATLIATLVATLVAGCEEPEEPVPHGPRGDLLDSISTGKPGSSPLDGSAPDGTRGRNDSHAAQEIFARAHHLDAVLGRHEEAERLYRRLVARAGAGDRSTALAHLRLAEFCRVRGDRKCAMDELDWLINHARWHPHLARRAERAMVDLLHPQAGRISALTRGPPVSFTTLDQVPATVAGRFRQAEKALLDYVRTPMVLRLDNVDAVLNRKRASLQIALARYEPLASSQFPNAVAAARFRQGSLHQDFADALGRLRLPEELLPRVASKLRGRFHAESVLHFKKAMERYREAAAITDVSAERWRQAAQQAEAALGRVGRRRGFGGVQ